MASAKSIHRPQRHETCHYYPFYFAPPSVIFHLNIQPGVTVFIIPPIQTHLRQLFGIWHPGDDLISSILNWRKLLYVD